MKIFKHIFLFLLLMTMIPISAQKVNLEAAFQKLDSYVSKREYYIHKKQSDIDNLKKSLRTASFDNDKLLINKRIYDEYHKFNSNSALAYARKCRTIATRLKSVDMTIQADIDEILILIYSGRNAAAKNELDRLGPITRIPDNMKAKYAMAALEYYMRFNREEIINDKDSLTRATIQSWKKYKDFLPADNWLYQYYEASLTDKDISNALYDILKKTPQPSLQAAMIEVVQARIAKSKGDTDGYYLHLINSAINDLCTANCETQAILYLIESPYVRKNSSRAYAYAMVCSENAKTYKDAGRSLNIVTAQSIITRNFESQLERKATVLTIIIALLALSLIVIFIELYLLLKDKRRKKAILEKLEQANVALQDVNKQGVMMQQQLKENNERLENELKYRNNNFINAYLLISRYIANMQKFKKNLSNLIIAGKIEQARKSLSATESTEEYLQDFYSQFDKAFLSTHPDFVERFNALLKPDKQMVTTSATTLTPELRIYALVSIGITDSVSIADFLHYSPQTIYNYRLKVRHNSRIPEKDFADTVEKLYYQ